MRQAVESKPGTGEWPRISAEDVREMIPDLDRVAEEMIDAIQRGVPEYARPLNDTYRASVRQAVTHAVHEFVERLINPAAPHDRAIQVFRNIGRNEASEGRSLEPLQNALRLGARVAWRRLGQRAARGAMDSRVLAPMGEAIFLYLDELAGACSRGYAEATAEVAGEMERRRRRLLDLIVVDPPASHDAIADLAQAARWALPRQVAALALEPRSPDYLGPLPALPPDVLIDLTRLDRCGRPGRAAGPGQQFAPLGAASAGAGQARHSPGARRHRALRRAALHPGDLRRRGTCPHARRGQARPAAAAAPGAAGDAGRDAAVLAAEWRERQGGGPAAAHSPADRAVPAAPAPPAVRRRAARARRPVRAGDRAAGAAAARPGGARGQAAAVSAALTCP